MDIVIPFRNTCGSNELDMCINLICKNLNIPYDNIYVIGDEYVTFNEKVKNIIINEQKYNKWLDSGFLIQNYIEKNKDKPFILFNDDFFITAPIDNIPLFYYGNLSNRKLATYVIDVKTNKLRLSAYGLNIDKFVSTLGDFKNFEVHIPMIVRYPKIMLQAIGLSKALDFPALKRSYYIKLCEDSNIVQEYQELPNDVKFGEPMKIIQYPFFSLTDDKEFKAFYPILNGILDK